LSNASISATSSVGHYENFPVASVFLPAALRDPVSIIYRFARSADDFADEGTDQPAVRLEKLDAYRSELFRIRDGIPPRTDLFKEVARVIADHELALQPFLDLLDAFSQDVVKNRYEDFAEVLDYCRRSAAPVGRLMLQLYKASDEQNVRQSDAICMALQLINFWQDVEIDLRKDRIYLPKDELARFGLHESALNSEQAGKAWHDIMRFQIDRARTMLESGAPLAKRLPGRIGLELRLIVQGGRRILEKIEAVEFDVFNHRPVLGATDWPILLWRAMRM
jgi:squalene synthase HpnC